jgi:hypothetical protein
MNTDWIIIAVLSSPLVIFLLLVNESLLTLACPPYRRAKNWIHERLPEPLKIWIHEMLPLSLKKR